MARPTSLDTSALTVSFGKAPARSTLVVGPIADAVRHTVANPGEDGVYEVAESQVIPLISKIRNVTKQLGYACRITTTSVTQEGGEVPVRQGDLRKDGKRPIKVYFRGRPTNVL